MKKKLRIIFVWTLVSLLLQYGAYYFLNNQVQKVMEPANSVPITLQLKATIHGSDLKNIQISYAKDYLAYTENGTLKVFNVTNEKVVFEKKSPSVSDKTLGVLTYQWLPDRNTLLYFYAKNNPNPVTYVTVYPPNPTTKTTIQTPTPVEPKTEDPNQKVDKVDSKVDSKVDPKVDPKVDSKVEPKVDSKVDPKVDPKVDSKVEPKVDSKVDPKVEPKVVQKVDPKEVPVKPRLEPRYGNPQITELYSLELPNSDEDIAPVDRFNQTIDKFQAGGKIEELVVSTSTNLMYLTVKNGTNEQLMEIDVMKNVNTLNKSGETIDNMAASDRYGTLYLDSKVGTTHQVVALAGTKRQIISKNNDDRILGIRDGNVYIGEVKNNKLVKIKTTADLAELTNNPSLKTVWDGLIPFDNNVRTIVGSKGRMVVYDHQTAYIVSAGQLEEVKLHGDENYVSVDGAELIRLTKEDISTLVELQPLK